MLIYSRTLSAGDLRPVLLTSLVSVKKGQKAIKKGENALIKGVKGQWCVQNCVSQMSSLYVLDGMTLMV